MKAWNFQGAQTNKLSVSGDKYAYFLIQHITINTTCLLYIIIMYVNLVLFMDGNCSIYFALKFLSR